MGDVIIGTAFGQPRSVTEIFSGVGQGEHGQDISGNPYIKADRSTQYYLSKSSLVALLNHNINNTSIAKDMRIVAKDTIRIATPLYLGTSFDRDAWESVGLGYRELLEKEDPERLKELDRQDRFKSSIISDFSAVHSATKPLKDMFPQLDMLTSAVTYQGTIFPAILCAPKDAKNGSARHIFQEYIKSKRPDVAFSL